MPASSLDTSAIATRDAALLDPYTSASSRTAESPVAPRQDALSWSERRLCHHARKWKCDKPRVSFGLSTAIWLAIVASAAAADDTSSPITPPAVAVLGAAGVLSLIGLLVAAVWGRRWTAAIGVIGMTRIALLSGVHFAISYTARIVDALISSVVLGPYFVYVSGIGGEVLPTLIQAVTVAIIPRPGALALSNLTVSMLNGICAGELGPSDLWFAVVGATLGELCLLLTGATRWSTPSPQAAPRDALWPVRCAMALAAYNGATWFVQYCMFSVLYRQFYPLSFIAAVSLIVGCVYGGLGAIVGAHWGLRLREIC